MTPSANSADAASRLTLASSPSLPSAAANKTDKWLKISISSETPNNLGPLEAATCLCAPNALGLSKQNRLYLNSTAQQQISSNSPVVRQPAARRKPINKSPSVLSSALNCGLYSVNGAMEHRDHLAAHATNVTRSRRPAKSRQKQQSSGHLLKNEVAPAERANFAGERQQKRTAGALMAMVRDEIESAAD